MANLLTGDYEAVLWVSGSTVNRLLATMHQNDGRSDVPSFPHSIGIRLGDHIEVDGVKGAAWAQVGAPRIELIDGSTDAFWLVVDLRIRFWPDPPPRRDVIRPGGGEWLPPYIEGTARVQYSIEEIDPSSPGWQNLAADYVQVRVVNGSVSFTGVGHDEDGTATVDDQAIDERIRRQLVVLLTSAFEPSPHPLSSKFRSFVTLDRTVAIPAFGVLLSELALPEVRGAVVAIPLGITADPPDGSIGSIEAAFLGGHDFGVALSDETIMGLIKPGLDKIAQFHQDYPVDLDWFSTVYRARVDPPTAVWNPQGTYAFIDVAVHGHAHTDSIAPDFDFSVDQRIQLDFDRSQGTLRVHAWNPSVSVDAGGVGMPSSDLHMIWQAIYDTVQALADDAVRQAQPSLERLTSGRDELARQLATIDDQADPELDDALFTLPGVILWGSISVASRKQAEISFARTEMDTISGFQSWLPGGWIDRLEWSWTWFNAMGDPGHASYADRFVLRHEPRATSAFRSFAGRPLPGLDGPGQVCLTVHGSVVNATTGDPEPVQVGPVCVSYSINEIAAPAGVRLLLREIAGGDGTRQRPSSERAVVDVTARGPSPSTPNTLLVRLRDAIDPQLAEVLRTGLADCRRKDAGLLVLVLYDEDTLPATPSAAVQSLVAELGAPIVMNEDVGGRWSSAFLIGDEAQPGWRLLGPAGGILWLQDGPISAAELTEALDACLLPSPFAWPTRIHSGLATLVSSPAGLGALLDQSGSGAGSPLVSKIRPADAGAVASAVCFARDGSPPSAEALHDLRAALAPSEGRHTALIVLDGAEPAVAEQLSKTLGTGFIVVADPDGARSSALDVRRWPTTVLLAPELQRRAVS